MFLLQAQPNAQRATIPTIPPYGIGVDGNSHGAGGFHCRDVKELQQNLMAERSSSSVLSQPYDTRVEKVGKHKYMKKNGEKKKKGGG